MAWTGVDGLNYSNGSDPAGQSGGSGWTGAWADNGTQNFLVTTTSPMEGTAMVYLTNGNNGGSITRTVSSPSATGILFVRGKTTITATDQWQLYMNSGANIMCLVRCVASGNVQLFNNLTLTNIENSAYSTNTEFDLYLEYDCDTDQYRARLGSAPSGSWYSFFNGGTATTIDVLHLSTAGAFTGTIYFDDVKSGASTGGSTFIPRISFIM